MSDVDYKNFVLEYKDYYEKEKNRQFIYSFDEKNKIEETKIYPILFNFQNEDLKNKEFAVNIYNLYIPYICDINQNMSYEIKKKILNEISNSLFKDGINLNDFILEYNKIILEMDNKLNLFVDYWHSLKNKEIYNNIDYILKKTFFK